MTGLAAARAAGATVYEAAAGPGGICSSYYVRPGVPGRLAAAPTDGEAYRFEIGGGHWIFGGDPAVLDFVNRRTPLRRHTRRSSVRLGPTAPLVPYPIQNHLHALDPEVARQCLLEIEQAATLPHTEGAGTMLAAFEQSFGPTLAELFFVPFNHRYTAGLAGQVAPQDGYKSPVDLDAVRRGVRADTPGGGYNATFAYPDGGLDRLAASMAADVDVRYGSAVVGIDTTARVLQLDDGTEVPYGALISTVPLHRAVELAGVDLDEPPDPHTSVLVVNIGAERGDACPDDHWVYDAGSLAGFHRVGFYDNVDRGFLPASDRAAGDRVSLYVERAYAGATPPTPAELQAAIDATVAELQDRRWIGRTEAVDPTWIDVAYTWARPGSTWRARALDELAAVGVSQVGRYGRWVFQGIADSIRDGFVVGSALRPR